MSHRRGGLLFACVLAYTNAYIYNLGFDIADESSLHGLESGVTLSEGPMFASHKGPFGGGDSTINVDWSVNLRADSGSGKTDTLNVHVAFLDSQTRSSVGLDTISADDSLTRDYCCTQEMAQDCGPGVQVGGLIQHPGPSGRRATVQSWNVLPASVPAGTVPTAYGNATYLVNNEGPQWMLVVVCDAHGSFPLPDGYVAIRAAFKNPHGYLPGQYYGMLPWSGVLFVVYLLLAAGYLTLFCMRRKDVIGLQWLILSVILMGCLEMAVTFGVYDQKNRSGIPTPCNVCPISSDYLAAVVLAVFKRAFSTVLLLAVAKGYGVVHPNLPWRTWLAVSLLGLLYLVFGSLNEVEKETSYGLQPSGWELPMWVISTFSVVYIYGGFADMRKALTESRQIAKRAMYDTLWRVIMVQLLFYVVVAGVIIAVRTGAVPWPWKSLFFLIHFWDLLYLFVLIAIAYIWRPGPDTAQYAYYAQPASSADEADFAGDDTGPDGAEAVVRPDTVGIELVSPTAMAGPAGAGPTASAGAGKSSRAGRVAAAQGRGASSNIANNGELPPEYAQDAFVIEAEDDDSGSLDGDLSRGQTALATGHVQGRGAAHVQAAGQSTGLSSGSSKERSGDTVRLAASGPAGETVDDRPLTEGAGAGQGQGHSSDRRSSGGSGGGKLPGLSI